MWNNDAITALSYVSINRTNRSTPQMKFLEGTRDPQNPGRAIGIQFERRQCALAKCT